MTTFARAKKDLQPPREKTLMGDAGNGFAAELAEEHIEDAIEEIARCMTAGPPMLRLQAAQLMLEIAAARSQPATQAKRTDAAPAKLVVASTDDVEAEATRRLAQQH